MKLKILIINRFIHPHLGGIETKTYTYEMSEALKAQEDYIELKKQDDNSGGLSSTEILITQMGKK